jgi:hypothetical protein
MWMPAAALALITDLREELAAERTARAFAMQRLAELKLEHLRDTEDLRRRLVVAQTNFEWQAAQMNQIQAERAQLLQARTGVPFAAPEIQVRAAADAPPTVDRQPAQREPTALDLMASTGAFDDVGDRMASILGIDPGELYAGPSVLAG